MTTALTAIDVALTSNPTTVTNHRAKTHASTSNFQGNHPLRSSETISLLRAGQSEDGSTIMHWAVEEGNSTFVLALLALAPSLIHVTDDARCTPLHSACLMGKEDIVSILLDHGANTLALDQDEWSPFIYALYSNSLASALLLIRRDEHALLDNLTILGNSLIHREVDVKLRNRFTCVSHVPEFHQLLNNLIQKTLIY